VSDRNATSTNVVENGILLGVIVLAVIFVFGVGLPKWIHESSGASTEKITLPSSISGGYVSAASPDSWKEAVSKKQVTQQTATALQQQAIQLSAQAAKNIDALGAGAASRMYVDTAHGSLMIVSAVRDRSAFLQGLSSNSLQKTGNSLCAVGSSSSGGSVVDCSRTSDNLTVEIQVQGGTSTADSTAKRIDEVWDKVS
jgi:hypothetical protein